MVSYNVTKFSSPKKLWELKLNLVGPKKFIITPSCLWKKIVAIYVYRYEYILLVLIEYIY